jgi:DNA-binding response OmpR family regulator
MADSILIAEDDPKIVSLLEMYLKREGYTVRTCRDGAAALAAFAERPPSLLILDLMLPEIDGIEVCRRIRAASNAPILMLTARVDEVDKLLGLSLGADDYVAKPFSPREVVARVKAILRRTARESPPPRVLRARDLEMDVERHRVTVGGREVRLTPLEFRLLRALLEAPARAFTRDALLEHLYPRHEADVVDRVIDVHVGNLRQKLGDDPARPRFIETIRGVGYRLA